jgi:predicted Zn-dependent protease
MKRLFWEGLVMLAVIAGTWSLLMQLPFTNVGKLRNISRKQQEKLGQLVIQSLEEDYPRIEGQPINTALDSLRNILGHNKKLVPDTYTIILLDNPDVNALAIPGNYILVFRGLIDSTRNADEMAGVLAHEIAHHQEGHIVKKLVQEVSFGLLLSLLSGNTGGTILRETGGKLISASFDRKQERKADAFAVQLMLQNNIDPAALGHFLLRLPYEDSLQTQAGLFSTHPHSKERAIEIERLRAQAADTSFTSVLAPAYWNKVKTRLNEEPTTAMEE